MQAGRLRHRVTIQRPVHTQDENTGAVTTTWTDVATVWSSIEAVSVRDFMAAQSEQSKVTTRITIRYRDDITDDMRLYHVSKDQYYHIVGTLADKDSGLDYLTLPCSSGLRE